MHRVLEGAASKSYGLQVAKLAGIPYPVLEEAKAQLTKLETQNLDTSKNLSNEPQSQLSFESESDSKLKKILQKTSPDELTPKQALELVYELKKLF